MAVKRDSQAFTQVLDQCLDLLLQQGGSMEACLQRYPQHAAELEPLLRAALETRERLGFTPSAPAKARARLALQTALRQPKTRPLWQGPRSLLTGVAERLAGSYRWAVAATAALVLVVLGGSGMVAASSDSVPGQPLYPVKRAVEQTRLTTTFDNQARAQLHAAFASRRSQEMAALTMRGDVHRAEGLVVEVDRQLRQVQHHAIPGLSRPVLDVTPGPELNGPPESLIRDMRHLRPSPADKRQLKALHRRMERELGEQDRLFQQALSSAPEPSREKLKKAHQATRQKYRALIQAVQWVAEEEPLPQGP